MAKKSVKQKVTQTGCLSKPGHNRTDNNAHREARNPGVEGGYRIEPALPKKRGTAKA